MEFVIYLSQESTETRQKLQKRIAIFYENPLHPILRNHTLKGKYKEYRSIDVIGDIRALYLQKEDEAILDVIGTHGQLYG